MSIKKFYKIFGVEIGIIPSYINIKNHDFLLGVQYDVLEVIESYDGDDQFGMINWLKRLNAKINDILL